MNIATVCFCLQCEQTLRGRANINIKITKNQDLIKVWHGILNNESKWRNKVYLFLAEDTKEQLKGD